MVLVASELHRFQFGGHRPAVTYGPSNGVGEWVLSVSTESGRVEIELGEAAMWDLWLEVRGVPWPGAENDGKDRLVRRLVQAANDADREMLFDALEALGGEQA